MVIRLEPNILNNAHQIVPDRLNALLIEILRALNASGGGGSSTYIKGAAWDGGGPTAIILPVGANTVYTVAPVSGTIQSAIALGDGGTLGSGSMTCEVWKSAAGLPTVANKISASAPITLSLANSSLDTTLTGWSKTVTAGDRLAFKLLTSTILTWIGVYLTIG